MCIRDRLCSCCGNIKKALKLSDRVYRCACGNMIDRDFQASINPVSYTHLYLWAIVEGSDGIAG